MRANVDGTHVGMVSEWARKRYALARAYVEWLAETARMDAALVQELDRLYPGVKQYAERGAPLRECSPEELAALAEQPCLILEEANLAEHVNALRASPDRSVAERGLLGALLRRPIKPR